MVLRKMTLLKNYHVEENNHLMIVLRKKKIRKVVRVYQK